MVNLQTDSSQSPPSKGYRATREMVHSRTVELASLDGRAPHEIRQADYERAKREVTCEKDPIRQMEILYRSWR